MRNTYLQMCDYGSRFRILKGGKISMVVSAFIAGATLLHAAPSGGVVTSGVASIAQSGVVTTVNQSSQKASINWQNFSIAGNETVNFNQPSASAITLNRVVGNEKSIINGALNANGQVWILNSNGVLFNANAKVNTSGILATTKALSDEDFQNGVYSFKGSSTASVVNLGEITINNGGYASLLANTVSNEGTIKAIQGFVTLTGANEATINLNGNSLVSLKVDKGVLDALVENKGAIVADGGHVYLTTNAVNELLKGVVNNTGIIEAKSMDDLKSEVILFAHGGTANVSGTIDATGGFVETSGKDFTIQKDAFVKANQWLIDPVDVTISDSSAYETSLNAGTPVTIQADNNIFINDAFLWNQSLLTLTAGNNININANLVASATASLAFEYGQATANGGTSRYTVSDGIDVLIPSGGAFTWKKGSAGTVNNLVLDNGFLRFGNGTEGSIDSMGSLKQPFYFDNVTSGRDDWYQLTFSSYPLDFTIGVNGSGYNDGNLYSTASVNYNGVTTSNLSSAISNLVINISNYYEKTGTISVDMDVTTTAGIIPVRQSYTLDSGARYMKAVTTVRNSTGSDISNARLWIGTQDDYVAENDSNYKTRGNIGSEGFVAVGDQTADVSKAIIISEDTLDSGNGAAILFYSTTDGTNTIVGERYRWQYILGANPSAMSDWSTNPRDSSYALYLNLGTLPNGQAGSVTWYYAAAPVSELNQAVNQVGESSGSIPTTPTTPPAETPKIIDAIVSGVAIQPPVMPRFVQPSIIFQAPRPQTFSFGGQPVQLMSTPVGDMPTQIISLGEIRQMQQESAGGTDGVRSPEIRIPLGQNSLIQLVNGGLNLPTGIDQEFFMAQR